MRYFKQVRSGGRSAAAASPEMTRKRRFICNMFPGSFFNPDFQRGAEKKRTDTTSLFIHATMADITCQSEYCNAGWGEVLTHKSPYGYANFGIAFGLGLSVVGAAWGIWLPGSSLVGAAVKAPRIRSKNLIRCVASVARGPRGRYRNAVAAGRMQKSGDGMGEAKRGPHGCSTFPPRGLGSAGSILR